MKFATLIIFVILLTPGFTRGAEGLLSVEETLALTQRPPANGVPEPDGPRANPDARPALYRLLDDRTKTSQWRAAIGLFIFIGTKEDVPKLAEWIKQRNGRLDWQEVNAVTNVFGTLGALSLRKVEGAEDTLVSMASPDFWKETRCTIMNAGTPGGPTVPLYLASQSLRGLAYTPYSGLDALCDKLLAMSENAIDRESVKRHVDYAKEVRKVWGIPEKQKELLDIMRPAKATARRGERNEAPNLPDGPSGIAARPCCGDGKTPAGPMRVIKTVPIDEASRLTFEEATKAFDQIKELLLQGQNKELFASLLDDGEPIGLENFEREKQLYLDGFPVQIQAIKAIAEAGLKPVNIRVVRTVAVAATQLDDAGKLALGESAEEFLVTYQLRDSKVIGKKLFPTRPLDYSTVSEDRELTIYMRKIAGKWYWNPFTW